MLSDFKNRHIKIGDLIKIRGNSNPIFTPGLVIDIGEPTPRNPALAVHVQWPNGVSDWFYENELKIVEEIEEC